MPVSQNMAECIRNYDEDYIRLGQIIRRSAATLEPFGPVVNIRKLLYA
jgi:hypothetical protein